MINIKIIIIVVMGSILPSVITILSNAISLRSIITIRKSIEEIYQVSHRRTDETRRVVIIITIECLLAILNSWVVDILLSFKHCGRSVALADDCPHFLRQSQLFFACCDLLNSMSNIFLYCFAGRRFRHELQCMLQEWSCFIRKCIPCYCRIEWTRVYKCPRAYGEQYMIQSSTSTKPSKVALSHYRSKQQYVQIRLRNMT